ncbi:ANTAR domain-containing protein [Microbacteriaceae bacterium 4G12]
MSTLGAPFDVETISASDDLAAQLSEAQLDVGEGPGWDAYVSQVVVAVPDLSGTTMPLWPHFFTTVTTRRLHVQSVYALPLSIGRLRIGAVTLYAEQPDTMNSRSLRRAGVLAEAAAPEVLRHCLDHRHDEPDADGPHSRRELHQATGMVVAQLRVKPADALLLIQAHAYASGRTMRQIASDITSRRISLES